MSRQRIVIVASGADEAAYARALLEEEDFEVQVVVVEGELDEQPARQPTAVEWDDHHLERLATLGTLAAGTAHEVNNLVTHLLATLYDASRSLSGLASSERGGNEERARRVRHDLESAVDACDQLRALARGITEYSNPAESGVIVTDLATILDETLHITGPELRRRAHIERAIGADTPRVRVNPSKLFQVFVNLLTNAAHAVSVRGSAGARIRIGTTREGGRARVDIEDTGCGIAPEVAARVFDPFFTTKSDESGTGLGLSVSRSIVEELGGELTFSSAVGKGTTFSVYLPAVPHRQI